MAASALAWSARRREPRCGPELHKVFLHTPGGLRVGQLTFLSGDAAKVRELQWSARAVLKGEYGLEYCEVAATLMSLGCACGRLDDAATQARTSAGA